MRDYAKVEPKAWHGETFKALRRRGSEALLVGLYLTTSPSSNMLGLFAQPILYMAHETGLGEEGARKGLAACIEEGFCGYDEASEMVWVHEMAKYQIASELKPSDLRCKGIQKDFEALPRNPFLHPFFARYKDAFHLSPRRDMEAPSKPLRSQEQEQEQEQEQAQEQENPSGSKRAASPRGAKRCPKDFEVSAELIAWAAVDCPGVDWIAETAALRDWEFKHPRKDWDAVWRTWMRSAQKAAKSRGTVGSGTETPYQRSQRELVEQATGGLVSRKVLDPSKSTSESTNAPFAISMG